MSALKIFKVRDIMYAKCIFLRGFLVLSPNMSGIENNDGTQYCYYNALLQCLSINQMLFSELEHHNVNHIMNEGKVCL